MAWMDQYAPRGSAARERGMITLLAWSFLALLCFSLILVSKEVAPAFHIRFDDLGAWLAALSVAGLGLCVPLLATARSPLGFASSFYLLAVTAGYLWLSYFTPLQYDHVGARLSAVASWAAFAMPALMVTRCQPSGGLLTHQQVNILAGCLICLSAGIAAWGYSFGFLFVVSLDGSSPGSSLSFPLWIRYAISICTTTILPFSYAWFFTQKRHLLAAVVLAVLATYYPITLNKTVLLTPFWLIIIASLLKFTSWRIAVILSLLLPMMIGIAALAFDPHRPELIFGAINFRMLAIPASAIDHYNHFFSTRPLTNFCHIAIIGRFFDCTLPDHLGVMLAKVYATGNYNASLLATEGIASVGIYAAPLTALVCGLVIAVGDLVSDRLEPSFVLLSSSILVLTLMNVPLSTTMLTHGGFLLFTLWFLTPRDIRPKKPDEGFT